MNNSLKKLIKVLIVIIIPVVVTVLMGMYGYNFYNKEAYKRDFEGTYYEDVKADTVDEINAFFSFNQDRYNKTPYYTAEVNASELAANNNGESYGLTDEKLFTISIYQSLFVGDKYVLNEKGKKVKVTEDLSKYIIVVYDFNYEALYSIFGKDLKKDDRPDLEVYLNPNDKTNDEYVGQKYDLLYASGNYRPCDYNKLPGYTAEEKENIDKSKISTYTTVFMTEYLSESLDFDFKMDFTMEIRATTDKDDNGDEQFDPVVLTKVNKTFVKEFNESDLTDLVKGHNGDYYSAGFVGYIIGQKLWWICALTFIGVFALTSLFVYIWSYEEPETKSVKRK